MRFKILPVLVVIMVSAIGYGLYMDYFVYTDSSPTRHDRAILARAERGEAQAQYLMGTFLITGRQGIDPDLNRARQWFEAAARQNYAGAQYRLGDLYRRGDGVERNLKKAATLFREAAMTGDRPAENALGDLYRDGDGVDQSYATALYWYQRAAKEGYAPAQRSMGIMAAKGLGMARDYRTAFRWYRKAAKQGDPVALSNLGIMYEHGQAVAMDPLRAWACHYRASLKLYQPARRRRDTIEATLSDGEWKRARELSCLDVSISD